MIEEVPSKVFNSALDKWLKRSMGIDVSTERNDYCSYCDKYRCSWCPLSDIDIACLGGLYCEWQYICIKMKQPQSNPAAMAIADKIVDYIISHCVY